jgi:hypothetical protein
MDQSLRLVTIILAISSGVLPILFGYVVFRMSQIFVTKGEFQSYQATVEREYNDLRVKLDEINDNTIELLQRTASMRHEK